VTFGYLEQVSNSYQRSKK